MLGGEGSFLVGSGGIGRGKGSNFFVTMCQPHGDIVLSHVFKFELNWGTPGRIEMVHTILFFIV